MDVRRDYPDISNRLEHCAPGRSPGTGDASVTRNRGVVLAVCVALFLSARSWGFGDTVPGTRTGDSGEAAAAETMEVDTDRDWTSEKVTQTLLVNTFVPGVAQYRLGCREEALLLAAGLPMTVIGMGITTYVSLLRLGGIEYGLSRDPNGTTFARYTGDPAAAERWLLYAGTVSSLYGALLTTYSNYAAVRDFADMGLLSATPVRRGRDSLGSLVVAPFVARHVAHPSVWPVLMLSLLQSVDWSGFQQIGSFFDRERVSFAGVEVPPLAGLALRVATAAAMVLPNATWEEIAYRGTSLEQRGAVLSSIGFGAAHLSNVLAPNVAIGDTVLQSLFATAFGAYAAEVVRRDGFRLHRAVALHFWNNVTALVLNYLIDPDAAPDFSLSIRVSG